MFKFTSKDFHLMNSIDIFYLTKLSFYEFYLTKCGQLNKNVGSFFN